MKSLQKVQSELIELLLNQVTQLSIMSKIELGDDVTNEIKRLSSEIEMLKSPQHEYKKGKVLAIDFDGVLHSYSNGWQDGKPYDVPVNGAKEALTELKNEGYHIMIYTTRCNHDLLNEDVDRAQDVEDYLKKHDIPYDQIYTGNGKPKFTVTVDDRALSFRGNWNETLQQIKSFKTWNRPDSKSSAEK